MLRTASLGLCRYLSSCWGQPGALRALSTSHGNTAEGILPEYQRLAAEGVIRADPSQLAAVQALQLLQEGLVLQLQTKYLQQQQQQQQEQQQQQQEQQQQQQQEQQQQQQQQQEQQQQEQQQQQQQEQEKQVQQAGATPQQHEGAEQEPSGAPTASSSSSSPSMPPVQGAYLWGPVGSGKTLLMDLFLKTLPAARVLPHPTNPSNPTTPSSSSSSSQAGSQVLAGAAASNGVLLAAEAERLHYHTFMLGVHHQLHQLQLALPTVVVRSRQGLPVYRRALPPEDPILTVARSTAASLDLLCLDELHVTDVADAMLLGRLFGELLRAGCCVVVTSNRPVRELYKGGLSRAYFEPFIHLVDQRLMQLRVSGGQDYRTLNKQQQQQQQQQGAGSVPTGSHSTPAAQGVWLVGPHSTTTLQQQWQQLAQQLAPPPGSGTAAAAADAEGAALAGAPTSIPLPFGRSLWVARALHYTQPGPLQQQQQQQQQGVQQQQQGVQQQEGGQEQQQEQPQQQRLAGAYFSFDELCGGGGSRASLSASGVLSANDYLALVQGCRHIFVEGLHQLQPRHRDQARRWVTLVDLLYEVHTLNPGAVRLAVSADVAPGELFMPLLGAAACQGVNPNLGRSGSKLDVKALIQEAKAQQRPTQPQQLHGSAVAGEDATVGGSHTQPGAAAVAAAAAAGRGGQVPSPRGAEGGQGWPQAAQQQQQQAQPPALLAEEVLMYHRASSRLVELCGVGECQAQGSST